MVCRNFTERGPVPQSSGAPVSPDRRHGRPPPARRPVPLLACHPAGSQGHSQRVLASPFPNLSVAGALAGPIPIARMPAAARPDVTCRSLKRPAEAIPTRIIRLLHGLPPGPGQAMYSAAAKTRGRPRQEEAPRLVGSCARAREPGVPGMAPHRATPPGSGAASEATGWETGGACRPTGQDADVQRTRRRRWCTLRRRPSASHQTFPSTGGRWKAPEGGGPGPALPDLAANRTALRWVTCHDAAHTPEGNGTGA